MNERFEYPIGIVQAGLIQLENLTLDIALITFVEIDGKRYRYITVEREVRDPKTGEWKQAPHTYRSFYAHTDPVTGDQGPGWDSRFSLADPEVAMRSHGRTFRGDEVRSPAGGRIGLTEDISTISPEALLVGVNGDLYDVSNAMPDTPMLLLEKVTDQPTSSER